MLIAIAALATVGCAEQKPMAKIVYQDNTGTVLAFDPPAIYGLPPVDLDRAQMEPSAFVGFEGPTITTYWIHTDDDMEIGLCGRGFGCGRGGIQDFYSRRTIMDKFGSLVR